MLVENWGNGINHMIQMNIKMFKYPCVKYHDFIMYYNCKEKNNKLVALGNVTM